VLVKTKKPVEGSKSNKGILISTGDETLELKTDKGNVVIPRNMIKSVNLEEDI
jgi:ribosome maturation factor RimP